MHTVHQNDFVVREGLVNKTACSGQPNQDIGVVDVFDRYAQMSIARCTIFCRDGFGPDRDDMGYTTFREDPRRSRRIEA